MRTGELTELVISKYAEIFMPHIVLPGGRTVVQDLLPKYQLAVDSGEVNEVKLLPGAGDER